MVHLITGKTTVYGAGLSTYSAEEVRGFSVCEVKVPKSLDPLTERPVPGGLSDLRMGPGDGHTSDRCETCRLPQSQCPGHFGHVELCLPLYNPLLLKFTTNLLGLTCHHCYRLKVDEKRVGGFAGVLRRLRCRSRSEGGEEAGEEGPAKGQKDGASREEGPSQEDQPDEKGRGRKRGWICAPGPRCGRGRGRGGDQQEEEEQGGQEGGCSSWIAGRQDATKGNREREARHLNHLSSHFIAHPSFSFLTEVL